MTDAGTGVRDKKNIWNNDQIVTEVSQNKYFNAKELLSTDDVTLSALCLFTQV